MKQFLNLWRSTSKILELLKPLQKKFQKNALKNFKKILKRNAEKKWFKKGANPDRASWSLKRLGFEEFGWRRRGGGDKKNVDILKTIPIFLDIYQSRKISTKLINRELPLKKQVFFWKNKFLPLWKEKLRRTL